MKEVLARCGMRCDLCASWQENIQRQDDRQAMAAVWKKYRNMDVNPAEMICPGCHNLPVDCGCPILPCVADKGVEHCGQCDDYPCGKFDGCRGLTMEAAAEIAGDAFSAKEYRKYLQAYDNGTRLDELRLDTNRIQRMTNEFIVPDVDAMVKFIGGEPAQAFCKLARFLFDQPDLKTDIHFGGRNYGWEIRAKRSSRPVITLTPVRHAFLALCVMGKAELEVEGLYPELLSERAHRLVADTHQFHDGKWVSLRAEGAGDENDVLGLFAIKRYGLKAREGLMAATQRLEEDA